VVNYHLSIAITPDSAGGAVSNLEWTAPFARSTAYDGSPVGEVAGTVVSTSIPIGGASDVSGVVSGKSASTTVHSTNIDLGASVLPRVVHVSASYLIEE